MQNIPRYQKYLRAGSEAERQRRDEMTDEAEWYKNLIGPDPSD